METFTVRDLRERTGELVRTCESGELAMLTKHGRPLCLTVPVDDTLMRHGVDIALAVQLVRAGTIAPGLGARVARLSLEDFLPILAAAGVPALDYPPDELEQELGALD